MKIIKFYYKKPNKGIKNQIPNTHRLNTFRQNINLIKLWVVYFKYRYIEIGEKHDNNNNEFIIYNVRVIL